MQQNTIFQASTLTNKLNDIDSTNYIPKYDSGRSSYGGITEFAFTSHKFIDKLQHLWTNRYMQNTSLSPWFTISEFLQIIRSIRSPTGCSIATPNMINVSLGSISVTISGVDIRLISIIDQRQNLALDSSPKKASQILKSKDVNTPGILKAYSTQTKRCQRSPGDGTKCSPDVQRLPPNRRSCENCAYEQSDVWPRVQLQFL